VVAVTSQSLLIYRSTGTPTGNVVITVNDASGDTCSGSVAAGMCNLTLTTPEIEDTNRDLCRG